MAKRIFCVLVISALMLCAFYTVALAADAGTAPYAIEKPSLDTDPTEGGTPGGANGENGESTENGGTEPGGTETGGTNNGTASGGENGTRGGINPVTVVILIAVPVALAAAAWLIYISVKKKN